MGISLSPRHRIMGEERIMVWRQFDQGGTDSHECELSDQSITQLNAADTG